MNQQIPIFSDVARWFSFPVLTAGNKPGVEIDSAGGTGFGAVVLNPGQYFMLTNFRASTNYDNAVNSGVFGPAATVPTAGGFLPFVPNNFTVQVQRGQNNNYSNQAMTQAEICSSGYYAGKQLPIPVIYGPRVNFGFTFTDTTGLFLTTGGEGNPALPLEIDMFMEGYLIPIKQWSMFLNYFPFLQAILGNQPIPGAS